MKLDTAAVSHAGRVRKNNEDNFYFYGNFMPQTNQGTGGVIYGAAGREEPLLFGVFDGMGGYAAGERASYLAAETVRQRWTAPPRGTVQERLTQLCFAANAAVCNEMRRSEGEVRIGTTASFLYIDGNAYAVCNIGDSPILLWREGVLREISVEHTERAVYERVTGQPTDPKRKFRLTQHIGIFPEEMTIEPYCATGQVQPGDVFLLCSDGVTDMLDPAALGAILLRCETAVDLTREILDQALAAGGRDNITAICVRVLPEKRFQTRRI